MDYEFKNEHDKKTYCKMMYNKARNEFENGTSLLVGGADLFRLIRLLEGIKFEEDTNKD